jgi:hypothetical protein
VFVNNKILIIDNFYLDPDKIRQFALRQTFKNSTEAAAGGNWPGRRTSFLHNLNQEICDEFHNAFLGNLLENNAVKYGGYIETNFQLCYASDGDSWVHYDTPPWNCTHVGVVYLNPNPPENSGTLFYEFVEEHREEFEEYAKQRNNLWTALNRDQDSKEFYKFFKQTLNIPNKYNRAIVYGPHIWHKSDRYFGSTPEDGRLFQPFFCHLDFQHDKE